MVRDLVLGPGGAPFQSILEHKRRHAVVGEPLADRVTFMTDRQQPVPAAGCDDDRAAGRLVGRRQIWRDRGL